MQPRPGPLPFAGSSPWIEARAECTPLSRCFLAAARDTEGSACAWPAAGAAALWPIHTLDVYIILPRSMVSRGTTQQSSAPYNRRIVLDVIRRQGRISRREIVDLVSLSPQTVANITNDLQTIGLIVARR